MIDPIFLHWYMEGPSFLMYPRLLVLLVFNELIAIFVYLPAKNGYKKKIKGQYMNGSTFQTIEYMNGSVFLFVFFSKARYMNGVGFEILARTPVPQLPRYSPLPAPCLNHERFI